MNDDEIIGATVVFLWASVSTILAFQVNAPMYVVSVAGFVGGLVTGFLRGAPPTSGASGGFWAGVFGGVPFIVFAGVLYVLVLYYVKRAFFMVYAPTYTLLVGSFLFITFVIGGIAGGVIGSVLRYLLILD